MSSAPASSTPANSTREPQVASTSAGELSRSVGVTPTSATTTAAPDRSLERRRAAYAALEAGELDRAEQLFAAELARFPEHAASAYALACIAAREGRLADALDGLAKAVELGLVDADLTEWDPDLAPLRGETRFAALVSQMRATPLAASARVELVWTVPNNSARYSSDGTRLATYAWNRATILDSRTNEIVAVSDSPGTRVTGIGFADADATLAVGGDGAPTVYVDGFDGRKLEDTELRSRERAVPTPTTHARALTNEPLPSRATGETPPNDPSEAPITTVREWANAEGTRLFRIQRERWISTAGVLLDAHSGKELARFADLGSAECRGGFSASGRCGWWFDPHVGEVHVFDADSGTELRVLRGSTWRFAAALADPARDELVTVGGGRGLARWSLASGDALREVAFDLKPDHGGVWASGDSRYLMRSEWGKRIEVWDVLAMESLWGLDATRASRWILGGAFSGDGERLALPFDDVLAVHDTRTGTVIRHVGAQSLGVARCALEPDGTHVVVGANDGSLRRIELASGRLVSTWKLHAGRVDTCEYVSGGERLFVGWRDGTLALVDVRSGAALRTFERTLDVDWTDAIVSADGRRVILRWAGGDALLLDCEGGEELAKLGPAGWNTVQVIHDATRRVAALQTDGTVALFDLETGAREAQRFEAGARASSLAISRDGGLIACGSQEQGLLVWRTSDGALVRRHVAMDEFVGEALDIRALEFEADGKSLVFTTGDYGTARRLELESGVETLLYDTSCGNPSTMYARPSASGKRLYVHGMVAGDQPVLEAATGRPLLRLAPPGLGFVDGTRDDRWVVGTIDHAVRVFGDTLDARYTYVPFENDGWLVQANSLHCAGTVDALRWAVVVRGDETYPFASCASELFDPKRVRAEAAGVGVRPAELGLAPVVRIVGEPIRSIAADTTTLELAVETIAPRGIAACEADLDGVPLDELATRTLARDATSANPSGAGAAPQRVTLRLRRTPDAGAHELRLVVFDRAGLGSRVARARFIPEH